MKSPERASPQRRSEGLWLPQAGERAEGSPREGFFRGEETVLKLILVAIAQRCDRAKPTEVCPLCGWAVCWMLTAQRRCFPREACTPTAAALDRSARTEAALGASPPPTAQQPARRCSPKPPDEPRRRRHSGVCSSPRAQEWDPRAPSQRPALLLWPHLPLHLTLPRRRQPTGSDRRVFWILFGECFHIYPVLIHGPIFQRRQPRF